MGGILVVGELAPDGTLTKLSTEVATLARALGAAGGGAVSGVVHGAGGDGAAAELARFVPAVVIDRGVPDGASASTTAAALSANLDGVDLVLLPASPDGRDLAGALSAITGRGVLANATAAGWTDDGAVTTHSVFGGKLITDSAFTVAGRDHHRPTQRGDRRAPGQPPAT